MSSGKIHALLWAVTALYLVYFFVHAYLVGNYEFFYYAIVIGVISFLVVRLVRTYSVRLTVLAGLSFTVFLNFMGGSLYPGGVRLYEHRFAYGLIGYDNITHFFGTLFLTFMVIEFLLQLLGGKFPEKKEGQMLFFLLAFFTGFGMVATVEVVEYIAVGFLGVEKQVGDYFNNATDLAVNFWGAFAAILWYLARKDVRKVIKWR